MNKKYLLNNYTLLYYIRQMPNVRKRPSETGRTNGQGSLPSMFNEAHPHKNRPELTQSQHIIRCKDSYFFVTSKLF